MLYYLMYYIQTLNKSSIRLETIRKSLVNIPIKLKRFFWIKKMCYFRINQINNFFQLERTKKGYSSTAEKLVLLVQGWLTFLIVLKPLFFNDSDSFTSFISKKNSTNFLFDKFQIPSSLPSVKRNLEIVKMSSTFLKDWLFN